MKDYHNALYHEIFISEEYAVLKPLLPSCKMIFDIGGHIGYFSLWALKQNSQLKIHFFEPFPQLIMQAKSNLQSYADQVIFNTFGLAKETGAYDFLFNPQKTMQSSLFPSFLNPSGEVQTVQCQNLNTYLENQHITQVDLLKLDIEGMEYEVLSDLSNENRKKIKNLIAEIHLLSDSDLSKRNHLKSQLSTYFSHLEIIPSKYTDKILLVFAHH